MLHNPCFVSIHGNSSGCHTKIIQNFKFKDSFTRTVNVTIIVFMSGTVDLLNVICKQRHRTALNPFLNGRKNGDIDGTRLKGSFTLIYNDGGPHIHCIQIIEYTTKETDHCNGLFRSTFPGRARFAELCANSCVP